MKMCGIELHLSVNIDLPAISNPYATSGRPKNGIRGSASPPVVSRVSGVDVGVFKRCDNLRSAFLPHMTNVRLAVSIIFRSPQTPCGSPSCDVEISRVESDAPLIHIHHCTRKVLIHVRPFPVTSIETCGRPRCPRGLH